MLNRLFMLTLWVLLATSCTFKVDSGPESCSVDDDCPGDQVCKVGSGTCVNCTGDNHCADDKVCNTVSHTCVECIDNEQCPEGRCHSEKHKCVQCVDNGDCEMGACDPSSNTCTECGNDGDCDDIDNCTEDACSAGQCVHTAVPDGLDCDTDSSCTEGTCVAGECTIEYMPDQTDCDDGDECTKNDRCVSGECIGMKMMDCTGQCDPPDCDDGEECTEDICIDGECHNQMKPDCGGECDPPDCSDFDECTNDWCEQGECFHEPVPGCGMDCEPPDCNDFDDCTFDWCDNGFCVHDPIDDCCPDLPEVCNGIDDDCDGKVDEDDVCGGVCAVIKDGEFGVCGAFLGYVFNGEKCIGISGCSCDPFCDSVFGSQEDCEAVCLGVTPGCMMTPDFGWLPLGELMNDFDDHLGEKVSVDGFVVMGTKDCVGSQFCPNGCTASLFIADEPNAIFKKLLLQGDVTSTDGASGQVECVSDGCDVEAGCFPFFPGDFVTVWGVAKDSSALHEHLDVFGYCIQ